MSALAPQSGVWDRVLENGAIAHVDDDETLSRFAEGRTHVVVIPLMEEHIRRAPRNFACLAPSTSCLDILADKSLYHADIRKRGFSEFLPHLYGSVLQADFPCLLKRTDMNGGTGIALVRTPDEAFALQRSPPWDGHHILLEEFIPGNKEFVMHAVCQDGRLLWHHTFQYLMQDEDPIRRPSSKFKFRSVRIQPETLQAVTRIVASLGYSGPLNIDFKLHKSRTIIFEINPRLGGSLMRPDTQEILAQSLHHIISAARGARQLAAT